MILQSKTTTGLELNTMEILKFKEQSLKMKAFISARSEASTI